MRHKRLAAFEIRQRARATDVPRILDAGVPAAFLARADVTVGSTAARAQRAIWIELGRILRRARSRAERYRRCRQKYRHENSHLRPFRLPRPHQVIAPEADGRESAARHCFLRNAAGFTAIFSLSIADAQDIGTAPNVAADGDPLRQYQQSAHLPCPPYCNDAADPADSSFIWSNRNPHRGASAKRPRALRCGRPPAPRNSANSDQGSPIVGRRRSPCETSS